MPKRLLLILPTTTYRAGAFLEAARRLGCDVTVGSDHTSVFTRSRPDELLRLDLADPGRAAEQVRAFAERRAIDAVFGVDDDTAVVAAHAAAALGIAHNSVEAVLAARDKHRQRELMARHGVSVPAFALRRFDEDIAELARAQRYPCVVKPTRLSMSRGVIRADDPGSFLAAVARLEAILAAPDARAACGDGADVFLVEDFVPGPEFAVEGVIHDGTLHVLAIFAKPDPLDGPFFTETIYATPSGLTPAQQQAVGDCVRQAARAIGLSRGPVHAEVRLNEHGAWLIELAARPIGGRCSTILRFGGRGEVSLEQLLMAQALGVAADRPADGSAPGWAPLEREAPSVAVMMIPVPRAGTLVSVSGVDEARLVPWIDDVAITANPGQQLAPLPEGQRYLGFIYAWAEDTATAVDAVRQAHDLLTVELA